MSDSRLRELERKWRESGSTEDEAAWLIERVRVGDLSQDSLELAAYCGHEAAIAAQGGGRPSLGVGEWAKGLGRWGKGACVVAGAGIARLLTSDYQYDLGSVPSVVEKWLADGSAPPPSKEVVWPQPVDRDEAMLALCVFELVRAKGDFTASIKIAVATEKAAKLLGKQGLDPDLASDRIRAAVAERALA